MYGRENASIHSLVCICMHVYNNQLLSLAGTGHNCWDDIHGLQLPLFSKRATRVSSVSRDFCMRRFHLSFDGSLRASTSLQSQLSRDAMELKDYTFFHSLLMLPLVLFHTYLQKLTTLPAPFCPSVLSCTVQILHSPHNDIKFTCTCGIWHF